MFICKAPIHSGDMVKPQTSIPTSSSSAIPSSGLSIAPVMTAADDNTMTKETSRIAESSNILDSGLLIRIELHNMKDRSLVEIRPDEPDSDRLKFLYYKCADNHCTHQKELTL